MEFNEKIELMKVAALLTQASAACFTPVPVCDEDTTKETQNWIEQNFRYFCGVVVDIYNEEP